MGSAVKSCIDTKDKEKEKEREKDAKIWKKYRAVLLFGNIFCVHVPFFLNLT